MKLFENLYDTLIVDNRYLFFLEGLKNTLIIAFFAVILGCIIGIFIALIRNYCDYSKKFKFLNFLAKSYVNIIRGTPSILQLMIIYYVIFASVDINIVLVGILAFGINSGAYVAEVIRAGINSIDKGQIEAGASIGFKYYQIMRYIILPQAIKNILPALGNEFITLVKETSVGAYIGIVELTKASDIIASRTYDYFFPLIIVAVIYFILTLILSKLVSLMERKLNNVSS
ncbi:MAG TPA: amino acid ABC transporter permease [Candidatus Onthocola stercorigallinarum]|jgi:His/Glu/Gln/Arg/opine family amino acid ABC transporter permease subunit|nr:amino acid ABC transporter permease [Candidatus Onthocola stercorigallinarum]